MHGPDLSLQQMADSSELVVWAVQALRRLARASSAQLEPIRPAQVCHGSNQNVIFGSLYIFNTVDLECICLAGLHICARDTGR